MDGYYDHMRLTLGIPEERDMSKPSDEKRRQIKQKTKDWKAFFNRPVISKQRLN